MNPFSDANVDWLLCYDSPLIFKTPITFLLLIVTVIITLQAFKSQRIKQQLLFVPYTIKRTQQWYRFLSHGFIHANGMHIVLNAFVLYSFGSHVEINYISNFGDLGRIYYVLLYILGLGVATIYSYYKHRDNPYYSALGASGAISGIVFAFILFNPTARMGLVLIPMDLFSLPAVVLVFLYFVYSSVMAKYGRDNIGHDAHFWGSVWGFAFTLALDYTLIDKFSYDLRTLF